MLSDALDQLCKIRTFRCPLLLTAVKQFTVRHIPDNTFFFLACSMQMILVLKTTTEIRRTHFQSVCVVIISFYVL
jgi:hypothetical protein